MKPELHCKFPFGRDWNVIVWDIEPLKSIVSLEITETIIPFISIGKLAVCEKGVVVKGTVFD